MRTNGENDSAATIARRKKNAALDKKHSKGMTNAQFAKTDVVFQEACGKAGVPVTDRQASKFRNKYGAAFNSRNK